MNLAKKLLKAAMWLALACAGLLLAAYLVVLAINWRDQPPSGAALRLLQLSAIPPAVADQDNAYVYMMGFSADPAQEPQTLGASRIATTLALLEKSPDAFIADLPDKAPDFKPKRSAELQALLKACSTTVDTPCLTALDSGGHILAGWLASEPLLLERYKALLSRPAYVQRLPFQLNTPLPPYAQIYEGQKLLLAQAWQLAAQGDAATVNELLTQDIAFWRQRLAASDSLIAKMVAARAVQRNFVWGHAILRRLAPALVAHGLPQPWTTPMSGAERAMLPSLAGEWATANSLFRQIQKNGGATRPALDWTLDNRLLQALLSPLLQPQDSSNKHAQALVSLDAALQAPYAQYPAAVERAQLMAEKDRNEALPMFILKRMYNPVGEVLLSIARPDFISYAVRVSDLEGLRRMAVLSTELRSQGTATGDMAQKLAEAAARNPYTGQPFAWDASAKAVVFTGLEKGERGRHALVD